MDNLNPNAWYRIPGYNGYEYCINAREVRSWKLGRKGYPCGYILNKKGDNFEYSWSLVSDANKRRRVYESEIADLLKTADILIDGTNSANLSPRMHLSQNKVENGHPVESRPLDLSYFLNGG